MTGRARRLVGVLRSVDPRSRSVQAAVGEAASVATAPTCAYAGVLDGRHLWCAVEIGDQSRAEGLELVSRATGERHPIHSETSEGRLESCVDLAELPVGPEGDVFDVALRRSRRGPRWVRTDPSALAPRDTTVPPSPDHLWRRAAYRTRGGRLAVSVKPLEACAEVVHVGVYPGLLRVECRFVGVTGSVVGDGPVDVLLRRRGGAESRTYPGVVADGAMVVDLRLGELGEVGSHDPEHPQPEQTWDVHVVGSAGELRVGRRTSDLRGLRHAIRYLASTHVGGHESRTVVRPYYTNDRYLALEVRFVDAEREDA